ncbi:carboxypeptidase-like regulatory domain-containing protein, partial [Methanobrevibacter sp. UBA337]|uniref:carboxypeptidase-like regulatory domain-containing protein n=3 Tax=Methanobacteriaceae TaxID=2159 RepID=UPI0039B84D76
ADKFNETYGAGQNFTGKLLDANNRPLIGQHVALKLTRLSDGASKVYWATTDTDGAYQLQINLYAGEYTAHCSYDGTSRYEASTAYNTITVTA